jgi:IPT/TIG domain
MVRITLRLCGLCLLLVLVVGCGGSATSSSGGNSSGNQQPGPTISAIAPSSAIAGNPATQLVVYGSGFDNAGFGSAVVNWNGSALTTTYVNPSQLTPTIPATIWRQLVPPRLPLRPRPERHCLLKCRELHYCRSSCLGYLGQIGWHIPSEHCVGSRTQANLRFDSINRRNFAKHYCCCRPGCGQSRHAGSCRE